MVLNAPSAQGKIAGRTLSAPIAIIVGLAVMVPIAPEARVELLDLLCLAVFLFKWKEVLSYASVKVIVSLFIIYSSLLLLSTAGHGLPFVNFIKREYGAVLMMVEVLGLLALCLEAGYRRQVLVIAAVMLGMSFHYFYPVDLRVRDGEALKFLLGIPLGVLGGAIIMECAMGYAIGRFLVAAAYVAYAGICFLARTRITGGVFFASAVIMFLPMGFVRNRRFRFWFPALLIVGLAFGYVLTEGYAALAETGIFGENIRSLTAYQEQFFGTILLGDRPQIVVNLIAIHDSPLIGHGANDQSSQYLAALRLLGVFDDQAIQIDDEILYHSMLFTAGHEAGILAMAFWFFLIYILSFALTVSVGLGRRIAPLTVPLFLQSVWDVLFSPLTPYSRWKLGLSVALALFWIQKWREAVAPAIPIKRE